MPDIRVTDDPDRQIDRMQNLGIPRRTSHFPYWTFAPRTAAASGGGEQPAASSERRPVVVGLASGTCVVTGLVVLFGWACDIGPLKTVFTGLVSMKVNTALGFILVGVALHLRTLPSASARQLRIATACLLAVIAIALAVITDYVFNWDLGIDELFASDRPPTDPYPGRPSPAAALNFCLLAGSLLLLKTRRLIPRGFVEAALLFVFVISSLALAGYIYGVASLYGFYPFSSMALHTAIAFLVTSLGTLYARADFHSMAPLRSNGPGGVLSRRMIPAVFGVTIFVGWLQLQGQLLGWYGLEFGLALYCIAMVVIFTALVWWISQHLDRTDSARMLAESSLKQNQAELAHVLRVATMNEMVAGISHELNQPLSAILNFASGTSRRLKSGGASHAEVIEVVETIAEESLRASEIIGSLNRYVQKCSPRRERVDLNDLLQRTVKLVIGDARRRGVAIYVTGESSLPPVFVDPVQLKQVVVNLLTNALDSFEGVSPPRAIILETRRTKPGEVLIAVGDNGGGLPADDSKIFDAFFTTKPAGLGMGLSISRSIVDAHEGRLWAERRQPRGTIFYILLPLEASGDV